MRAEMKSFAERNRLAIGTVGGAVVHRRVKAPLVGEKRALLGAAGDPYDACAVGLGQLAGNRADRTGWCPARCVRLGVREGESGGFDRP